ncbi:MAG: hypothetical protein AB1489_21380 [Acidobacteriota bacterium]
MSGIPLEPGKDPSAEANTNNLSTLREGVTNLLSAITNTNDPPTPSMGELEKAVLRVLTKRGSGRRTKLTYEQILAICRGYLAGKSTLALGMEFSLSTNAIVNCLDNCGIARRSIPEANRKTDDAQRLEICQMYRNGKKVVEIAQAFNLCDRAVYNILEARGVIRKNGRLPKTKKRKTGVKVEAKTRVAAKPKRKVRAVATKKSKSSTGSARTKRSAQGGRVASRAKTKAKPGRPANTRVVSKRSAAKGSTSKTGRSKR